MKRRSLLILSLLLLALIAKAQSLVVSAPGHVTLGENIRVTYSISSASAKNFRIGNMPDGLELIAGPYESQQSSFQMINGHTSSSSSTTYTLILCSVKNGTFVIPAAHVNLQGKNIPSKAVKIHVSGSQNTSNGAPKMHEDAAPRQAMRAAGSPITSNDLFIKVTASKNSVYEQEPVLLTYKVYTLVELRQLEGKMPELTGFHTQEIPLPQQKSFHIENVNGRPYRCVTWNQYVMFPQMTGRLEIPSIAYNGSVVQQVHGVDPFEEFFNPGSSYTEVKRSIKAPKVVINVKPLPEKPTDFSGGVGRFTVSATLSKQSLKAGEPLTMRIVVSGNGNMKLLKQPQPGFPKDFDVYDAKVTDKTRLTLNGLEGSMVYDITAVPRNKGKYTVAPVKFVYYNTATNRYESATTQSFAIDVKKGDGTTGSYKDFTDEYSHKDICPIKEGLSRTDMSRTEFFLSNGYWGILAAIVAAFVCLMVVFRKRALRNADIVGVMNRRANKIAMKRLSKARKLMRQGKDADFYDEVLRALWDYVGYKLNIPVEELSKENISARLSSRQVEQEQVQAFVTSIDECEFERYAPGDKAGNMKKTYTKAQDAIIAIEDAMKRIKRGFNAKVLLPLLVLAAVSAQGATKQEADKEFKRGNYQSAISLYEGILKREKTAEVYYNLGNAYYRSNDMVHSVLSYERALRLSPMDKDIYLNLQIARSKTIDKIREADEVFPVRWFKSLVCLMSVDGWGYVAIASLALALLLLLLYLFANGIALRKAGFFGSLAFVLLFVLSNVFALSLRHLLREGTGAIVTAPSVVLKKLPEKSSANAETLHEGTRVDVVDQVRQWKQVRTADGKEGWLLIGGIEMI